MEKTKTYSAERKGMKFFCEYCGNIQEVEIEPLSTDKLNKPKIWADILCKECHFVIATIEAEEPGIYNFIKVKDLPQKG